MTNNFNFYTYESIKEFDLPNCETFDDFIIILHLYEGDKKLRLSIVKKHTNKDDNPFARSKTSKIDDFCEKYFISNFGFIFFDKNMNKIGDISKNPSISFSGLDIILGESTPLIINPIYIFSRDKKINFIAVPND